MLPKDRCNFRVGLCNPLGVMLLGFADNQVKGDRIHLFGLWVALDAA